VADTTKVTTTNVTGDKTGELVLPSTGAVLKVTGLSGEEDEGEVSRDDERVAHDLKVEPVVTFLDQFFQFGAAVTDLKDLVQPIFSSSKLNWLSKIRRIRQRKAPTSAS
jgi:hypothetical protein